MGDTIGVKAPTEDEAGGEGRQGGAACARLGTGGERDRGVAIKEEEDEASAEREEGSVDYKAGGSLCGAEEQKSGAVSEFAKTKSIKEQREYLPVFGVRSELLG